MTTLLLLCSVFALIYGKSNKETDNAPTHLNIHIVAHSHDDTGWLITADQYYVDIVQWIFYSMIPTLETDPNHLFSYVEMANFYRWWNSQNQAMKNRVLKLINSKQLQLNLAGWCMNDEATPTMSQEIRQMTDGAQFALYNFGSDARARVGWHIDPFGSSFVTAGMWSQIGFDTFGINRINYQELQRRKDNKDLEFIWKGSTSLGEDAYIFTHILDSFYSSPGEIYFHGVSTLQRNGGDPANDVCYEYFGINAWLSADKKLPSYKPNTAQIAETFINNCREKSTWYKHNELLIPFGDDFAHANMMMSFVQMDQLMDYINNNKTFDATVKYSSLYDYTKAVNALNLTWKLETVDFFDYAIGPHRWWVGFFTSRPDLKQYTRICETVLRASELFYTFAKNKLNFNQQEAMENITLLRHAEDVAQHHDAITGTAADYVNNDYKNMLRNGVESVLPFTTDLIEMILNTNHSNINNKNMFTLDISVEILNKLTASNIVPITLYNSLAWKVTQLITIPTDRNDIVIYDSNEKLVTSQINPVTANTDPFSIPSTYNLYFIANDLLPLSLTTYFIKMANTQREKNVVNLGEIKEYKSNENNNDLSVGNGYYSLTFDGNTNLLSSITNNDIKQTLSVTNNFQEYASFGEYSGWEDNDETDDPWQLRPVQDNRYKMDNGENMAQINNIKFRQFNSSIDAKTVGFITQNHISDQTLDIAQIHICDVDVNAETFSFQYFPVDANNPCIGNYDTDWLVFGDNNIDNNNYFKNKYYSTITVTKSNSAKKTINIDLSSYGFKIKPMIFTTVRKPNCNDADSFYGSIVKDITATTVTIAITRLDSDSAWTSDLYIDYIVFDATTQINNDLSTIGNTKITMNAETYQGEIIFTNVDFVPNEPVVLIQLTDTNTKTNSYNYVSSAINNNRSSFKLNVHLFGYEKGDIASFDISYWAFERITMKRNVSNDVTNKVITGPVLDEVQQLFATNYSQSYILINNKNNTDLKYIKNDYYLGWINDYTNLVSHFDIDMNTNNTITTCQNSLEYIDRLYNPYCDERVACNLWPTSSQSYVRDLNDKYRFSTIMSQGHGTNSMGTGQYEILLQRRCATKNEYWFPTGCMKPTTDIKQQMYILYDESQTISYLNRRLYLLQQFIPLKFYSLFEGTIKQWKTKYSVQWTVINKTSIYYPNGLPENIHLLDLRYAYSDANIGENNGIILQLWNMFEINENSEFSKNETINLQAIFDKDFINIQYLTEMTLTANLPLNNLDRLKWTYKDENGKMYILDKDNKYKKHGIQKEVNALNINMNPRNIRTFVVNQRINQ